MSKKTSEAMPGISRRDFLKGTAAGALGIAAASVFGIPGGSSASVAHAAEAVYTPGTYTATAAGMGEVTVTMTFDETSITDVVLDVSNETPDIGQAAADELKQMILDAQSAEIDCRCARRRNGSSRF